MTVAHPFAVGEALNSTRSPRTTKLGLELRSARVALGWNQRTAAAESGFSNATLSRWETGKHVPRPEYLRSLLATYRVPASRRDELVELARDPDGSHWVAVGLPGQYQQLRTLRRFERQATRITDVSPLLIPGLLQTEQYTRAIMAAAGVPATDIDARAAVRRERAEILTQPDPVQLVAVIGAAALHHRIGNDHVMLDQLRWLSTMAERANVLLHVLPEHGPWHPALEGPFILVEGVEGAVVHVENRRSALFFHQPTDVDAYRVAVDLVLDAAAGLLDSASIVADAISDLELEMETR